MVNIYPTRAWLAPTVEVKPVTPTTVDSVLVESAVKGGLLARWKMKRVVGAAHVALTNQAVEVLFANKSEELKHRAALELDRAKKRAIAESLADTAAIEKAIVDMTNQVFHELDEMVHSNHQFIYQREQARLNQLAADVQAGRMTSERFEDACSRLRERVTDHLVRVEGMAERLIENMGERWRRTLNNSFGEKSPSQGG